MSLVTPNTKNAFGPNCQRGVTLIELVVFIVIISVALVGVLRVFNQSQENSADPLIRLRALELAQAQLDAILTRKFDENTPTGGVPACGSVDGPLCLGIATPDSDFDDVGDFNGLSFSQNGFTVNVTVVESGNQLAMPNSNARLITVTVSTPATSQSALGSPVSLSAFKVNF